MVQKFLVRSAKNPDYPSLDTSRLDAVASYLSSRNFLHSHERVTHVAPAGAVSRNRTVRVVTTERSLVLKHFVEWPSEAGVPPSAEERFIAECRFYQAARIASCSEKSLPVMLHHDHRERCILFKDLGADGVRTGVPDVSEASALAWFLVGLHHHSQSVPATARYDNSSVRQWLATRLFAGTQSGSPRRRGRAWITRVSAHSATVRARLSEARLVMAEGGVSLVHGEFTPGNWLLKGDGVAVLDAEHSFFGRPEIDAGSLLAGLLFRRADAQTLAAAIGVLSGGCVRHDPRLVMAFAGAQLCDLIDVADGDGARPSGPAASAMIKRVARAIEAGSWVGLLESGARRRSAR